MVGFSAADQLIVVLNMNKAWKNKESISVPFLRKLLEIDPDVYTGLRRKYVRAVRVVSIIVRDFLDDRCLLRASALAFNTILSLVPFFALAFAVLKGLGVHNFLEPIILGGLAVGSHDIASRIIQYINNTKMGSVGAVGLVALIVTVVTLLGNIEEAFNDIWGVTETRTYARKFSDYISVVVITPILLLAAASVTTSLQSETIIRWLIQTEYVGEFILTLFKLVPYLSIWIALVFLYIFIPNTKVRLRSAVVGGLLTGVIWQIAQWGYIHFQVGVSRYNAIYGTLSALPVFMVWIYTSWIIVLFGVEVVYAHQNSKTFLYDIHHPLINYASRELSALVLLLAAADSYHLDKAPRTCDRFSEETGIPVRIVKELLSQLVEGKYLVATEGEDPAYVPARALEHMLIPEFVEDMKNYGEPCRIRGPKKIRDAAREALFRLKPITAGGLEKISVKDIVQKMHEEESGV